MSTPEAKPQSQGRERKTVRFEAVPTRAKLSTTIKKTTKHVTSMKDDVGGPEERAFAMCNGDLKEQEEQKRELEGDRITSIASSTVPMNNQFGNITWQQAERPDGGFAREQVDASNLRQGPVTADRTTSGLSRDVRTVGGQSKRERRRKKRKCSAPAAVKESKHETTADDGDDLKAATNLTKEQRALLNRVAAQQSPDGRFSTSRLRRATKVATRKSKPTTTQHPRHSFENVPGRPMMTANPTYYAAHRTKAPEDRRSLLPGTELKTAVEHVEVQTMERCGWWTMGCSWLGSLIEQLVVDSWVSSEVGIEC
jgi:hypothetical protein